MAGKAKAPEKRKYERDEPVSLRPLDTVSALAALLRVKPPASDSPPPKSVPATSAKSKRARKRG